MHCKPVLGSLWVAFVHVCEPQVHDIRAMGALDFPFKLVKAVDA